MPLVPAIPVRALEPAPAPDTPLAFAAPLAYEDRLAGHMHAQWPRLGRHRRRILTVGLPTLWLITGLGTVSAWATADGRRDFATMLRDLPRFDPAPLAICLAVTCALLVAAWAIFPARMRRQIGSLMGPHRHDGPVCVRYRLDRDGITQTLPDLVSFVPWTLVRGLGEDRRRLFIDTAVGEEPIAIRKDALAPEAAESLRLRVLD